MRITHPDNATNAVVSLDGATRFGPILDSLAARLGPGWYLEATRTCENTSLLLVMPVDDKVDLTLTVTETPTGFVLDEMEFDQLRRIGECQTLDQVTSLVVRRVFKAPAHSCVEARHSDAA